MKTMFAFAGLLLVVTAQHGFAAGVCSTGKYDTCITCCQTNASITNRGGCAAQCEGYKKTASRSAGVLSSEPSPGQLNAGQRVLVDDGSCPAGQIKQVTGGSNLSGGASHRTRRCVKR
jgi:hypothetical protein